MTYTPEEQDILAEEYFYQEAMNDAYNDVEACPASMRDLITSENDEIFYRVRDKIIKNESLSMTFGINQGLPYFGVLLDDKVRKLYLNKEIIQYILNWIAKGKESDKIPDLFDVHKNANENYGLYLLKNDHKNGVTNFNQETKEFKAIYPKGTINYGKLPYNTDELIAKLNSLH